MEKTEDDACRFGTSRLEIAERMPKAELLLRMREYINREARYKRVEELEREVKQARDLLIHAEECGAERAVNAIFFSDTIREKGYAALPGGAEEMNTDEKKAIGIIAGIGCLYVIVYGVAIGMLAGAVAILIWFIHSLWG